MAFLFFFLFRPFLSLYLALPYFSFLYPLSLSFHFLFFLIWSLFSPVSLPSFLSPSSSFLYLSLRISLFLCLFLPLSRFYPILTIARVISAVGTHALRHAFVIHFTDGIVPFTTDIITRCCGYRFRGGGWDSSNQKTKDWMET